MKIVNNLTRMPRLVGGEHHFKKTWKQTLLFIRSSIFNVLFWINTTILSSLIIILRPLGIKSIYHLGKFWSRLNLFLLKIICGISYEVKIHGKLPDGPVVFLAKHQSAWETIAFPAILPPFMWVLKRELFYIPIFGWCLMALGHIGINRKAGSRAIKQINMEGKGILNRGFSMVIFPEGTRVEPGSMGRFNPGGVGLAIDNGVPVVPVTHNAGKLWSRRSFGKKPGRITIIIEEAIPTTGVPASERKLINNRVSEIISNRLKEIEG